MGTCPGGSNEYPQSMFWIKSKKNGYTVANPSFASISGYVLHGHVMLMSGAIPFDLHNAHYIKCVSKVKTCLSMLLISQK